MATKKKTLLRPDEIKAYLDQYVIGQEEAKKVLSVAVYNHYKKLEYNEHHPEMRLEKSNIMLVGETGSGKTLMARLIAQLLDVPCYIQDCTKITEAGYVGSDVEDCLVGLLRSCNYNMERARRGIVVLDEIDKCAKRSVGPSITRDVSGEGVQQSLLKIVEGDLVGVPPMGGRKHPEQQLLYVDTRGILFIASGAFVGLDKIVSRRVDKQSIGFGAERQDVGRSDRLMSMVTPQDLRDFGMMPEFVGRFPVITHVNKLTEESLVRILTEPKDAIIRQYTELLALDKTDLEVTPEALREIAHVASVLGTGARGLRNIVERVMIDAMYEAPLNRSRTRRTRLTIDRDYVVRQTVDMMRAAV